MKPVVWMGSSRENLRDFPEALQDYVGFELYRVQCGLDPRDWKPMPTVGAGVREIRVRDAAGIFRVIYLATRPERIYVLHCFQKKTEKTSKADVEVAAKRYRELLKELGQ